MSNEDIEAVDEFLKETLQVKPVLSRQNAHDLCKRFGVHYSNRGTGLVPRVDLAARLAKAVL